MAVPQEQFGSPLLSAVGWVRSCSRWLRWLQWHLDQEVNITGYQNLPPGHLQKQLSFAVGWLCAFGWQAAMPRVAYVGAQQVLAVRYPWPQYGAIIVVSDGWPCAVLQRKR